MKERLEVFGYSMEQFKSRLDLCLWLNRKCVNKAIRAHSVQNRQVLEVLCQDGHVIMPSLDITAQILPRCVFRKVGRNMATTFTGLCSNHDSELFRDIEVNPIDVTNSKHLFLLAYRAVLKEAHDSIKAAVDIQLTYQKGVEKGIFPNEPCPPGMLAVEHMIAACLVDEVKQRFDEALLNANWGRIRHEVIELTRGRSLAVNSMFSTDIYSEATDAAAYVILNVFPYHDKTMVVFSFLEENGREAQEAFGYLCDMMGCYQQYELSKLILRKCGNFVLAPTLYDAFSEQQKETIRYYFERNTCGHFYDVQDRNLFLFHPV
jgi:hypothetical protein